MGEFTKANPGIEAASHLLDECELIVPTVVPAHLLRGYLTPAGIADFAAQALKNAMLERANGDPTGMVRAFCHALASVAVQQADPMAAVEIMADQIRRDIQEQAESARRHPGIFNRGRD